MKFSMRMITWISCIILILSLYGCSKGPLEAKGAGRAIEVDQNGDPYFLWLYSMDMKRSGIAGAFGARALVYGQQFGAFTSSGVIKWARGGGMLPGTVVDPFGIAVDGAGAVYTAGRYGGNSAVFDPANPKYPATGSWDAYVAKYIDDGKLEWYLAWGGDEDDIATDICLMPSGKIVAVGGFLGEVDLDPSIQGVSRFSSNGGSDIFLSFFDSSGSFLGTCTYGGPGNENATAVNTDPSGNLWVTGSFKQTIDFGAVNSNLHISSNGGHDCLLLKCDSVGTPIWAGAWGGSGEDTCFDVAFREDGHILAMGRFTGTADLDPSPAILQCTTIGNTGSFICSLEPDGALDWAATFVGEGQAEACGMCLDDDGNIYVVGQFKGKIDFDPGPDTQYREAEHNPDAFIVKLDETGAFIWLDTFGDPQVPDFAGSIAASQDGTIWVTGILSGAAFLRSYSPSGSLLTDYLQGSSQFGP